MKYLFLTLFSILLFTSCSKKEQIGSPLDGTYVGILTGEWEKVGIKNFQTKPDTTYSSNTYIEQDVRLILEGNTYTFSATAAFAQGDITIEGDSISFGVSRINCFHDCSYYLSGERVKFTKSNNSLEMTFKLEKYERQYNFTDKDITTEKRVYNLKKID